MQIAINVNDTTIATQILNYLQQFKKSVDVQTLSDDYLYSKQFQKDKQHLHKAYSQIKSNPSTLKAVDARYWESLYEMIRSS